MPARPKGAGTSSTTDYEELTYETPRLGHAHVRPGRLAAPPGRHRIAFAYDALGRMTFRDTPNAA